MAERPIDTPNGAAVARLRRRLQGQVLVPDEDGYHPARRVWNAIMDRWPAVIARCQSPSDVAAAVGIARTHELEVGYGAAGTAFWACRSPRAG